MIPHYESFFLPQERRRARRSRALAAFFTAPFFTFAPACDAFDPNSFKEQGYVHFDGIGNITAHISDHGIRSDAKVSRKSVVVLLVYNRGAILSKERALEINGTWGCPHGRASAPTEDDSISNPGSDTEEPDPANDEGVEQDAEVTAADKANCLEGIAFSNDPGFQVPPQVSEFRAMHPDTGELLHPVEDLRLKNSQWILQTFAASSYEVPAVYLQDYNLFQSLTTPRDEDERFEAYAAIYYDRKDAFLRNEIKPDRISQKIAMTAKFTPSSADDVAGNVYPIPAYGDWLTDLYELDIE